MIQYHTTSAQLAGDAVANDDAPGFRAHGSVTLVERIMEVAMEGIACARWWANVSMMMTLRLAAAAAAAAAAAP
eukprot:2175722-Rhodomonas_salina.2